MSQPSQPLVDGAGGGAVGTAQEPPASLACSMGFVEKPKEQAQEDVKFATERKILVH